LGGNVGSHTLTDDLVRQPHVTIVPFQHLKLRPTPPPQVHRLTLQSREVGAPIGHQPACSDGRDPILGARNDSNLVRLQSLRRASITLRLVTLPHRHSVAQQSLEDFHANVVFDNAAVPMLPWVMGSGRRLHRMF